MATKKVVYAPWTGDNSRLWIEVRKGNARKVRMFVMKNPTCVSWFGEGGLSALHSACNLGWESVAEVLLSAGAQPNAQTQGNTAGETALHLACAKGFAAITEMLLVRNADPNRTRRSDGCTPLHVAAENGALDSAKLLLSHGAVVDALNTAGETPLLLACRHGKRELALALLAAGADKSKAAADGSTPETVSSLLSTLH